MFCFGRSLEPRVLAETLCGSPLYMAPEIMQLQKDDAKADLWSVGTILFQLATGKTPFTGNNQMQLLKNIMKSTELHFPPHTKNLSSDCIHLCRKLICANPGIPILYIMSSYLPEKVVSNTSSNMDPTSKYGTVLHAPEDTDFRLDSNTPLEGNVNKSFQSSEKRPMNIRSRVVDSWVLIDQDYGFVSRPSMDVSSSSASASKLSHMPCKLESPHQAFASVNSSSSSSM
ncbi:hypothetical protein RHGRI_029074 [Rhododendron griersonianum]|uniref:Protein kinase domain-containing protein n=1 Tax=Rhododendron griersonianum TaxID=479676 RepID=A0AAV6IIE4_9ERIC|nr:hypothetical protein RHGRI_029074 [Rhododendron griersonianum]